MSATSAWRAGSRAVYALAELGEDLRRFRVVADRRGVGAGQHEPCLQEHAPIALGEPRAQRERSLEPYEAVEQRAPAFQPVPARHLEHDRPKQEPDLLGQEGRPQRAVGLHALGGVVEGWLDRRPVFRDELGIDQDPDELVDPQLPVLVTERVESRVDDRHRAGQLRRHVLGRREECRVVACQVGREEVPGGACLLKILVDADVAAPDGGDAARRAHARAGAERLRIVHHEHVAVGELRQKLGRELGARPIVERPIGGGEVAGLPSRGSGCAAAS